MAAIVICCRYDISILIYNFILHSSLLYSVIIFIHFRNFGAVIAVGMFTRQFSLLIYSGGNQRLLNPYPE